MDANQQIDPPQCLRSCHWYADHAHTDICENQTAYAKHYSNLPRTRMRLCRQPSLTPLHSRSNFFPIPHPPRLSESFRACCSHPSVMQCRGRILADSFFDGAVWVRSGLNDCRFLVGCAVQDCSAQIDPLTLLSVALPGVIEHKTID